MPWIDGNGHLAYIRNMERRMNQGNRSNAGPMETKMAKANTPATSANKASNTAEAPRLRVIPSDETFSRSINVDAAAQTVTVKFAVKTSKEARNRYEVQTVLDFSTCDREDLLTMAADQATIAVQRMWRVTAAGKDADKAYDPRNWQRFNVKADIIDASRSRGPVDPVLATRRNLEKMGIGPAEVEAILATIQKTAEAAATS